MSTIRDRSTYDDDEIAGAHAWFYAAAEAARDAGDDVRLAEALLLSLDRWFVHRQREVAGDGTNPLTELGLVVSGIMSGGTFMPADGIDYRPEDSVLGIRAGAQFSLTLDDAETLAGAFFGELEARFGE
ncbi:hypothetical protein [Microbacterium terricola]|nr:hypothetical protein [Microbacterium terricola]UYK40905.1 hypothetical protein OAU46_04460 [Microbacterium terricola]